MLASSLQHTAQHTKHERQNFYRLVYQTARGKMDMPHDQFKGLVLRLLGDKDHGKSEKHYRQKSRDGAAMSPY